jgi:hypothetical protein
LQDENFRTDLVCRANVEVAQARVSGDRRRFPARVSDYVAAGPEFDEETVGGRTSPLESPSRRP